jgi:putative restriction endonuclease
MVASLSKGRRGEDTNKLGAIDGVEAGAAFPNHRALYDAGVHRALRAGIVGWAREGAESIVLSGGYVDDEDHGSVIIYTEHGGARR